MDNIKNEAKAVVEELCSVAKLNKGDIFVVGCSTSEVLGDKIGTNSSPDAAKLLFAGLYEPLKERGIYLAIQCCEHLNRAIVIERAAVPFAEYVNVVPQPKAGGSLATEAYNNFENPVVVESIRGDAGVDIGGTLIGMHLKAVAVPVRLSKNKIGEASIIAARTRCKFIGGERARYNENLM
ncbi:MAG: TIGR01440 family protein [Ruminococcaceae bacterium]|nr:TIGR01440 family protein [Oscillospiraceae bacterium]